MGKVVGERFQDVLGDGHRPQETGFSETYSHFIVILFKAVPGHRLNNMSASPSLTTAVSEEQRVHEFAL